MSLSCLQRGQIDGIGVRPRHSVQTGDGWVLSGQKWLSHEVPNTLSAISIMSDWVRHTQGIRLRAVGHRVMHSGPDYAAPVRIDADTLQKLAVY